MNIVDIAIIFTFITALMRGAEIGIVRQAFLTLGLLAGLFAGVVIQGKIIHFAQSPTAKALLTTLTLGVTISCFLSIGGYIGNFIRQKIERARVMAFITAADRILGASISGMTILVAVWLGAPLFKNVPLQELQQQVHNSVIVAELGSTLPPAPNIVASLGHLIDPNTFPDVFMGLEPRLNTNTSLPSIGELDSVVQQARASVVKIEGLGCGGISQGSGFVSHTNIVITNAHVVAGVKRVFVIDSNGRHAATVTQFDPNLDFAVLRTSALAGQPLSIATDLAANNTPGAVLGYPGDHDFTARPATILETFKAVGRNIYNQDSTTREVYSVKVDVEPGNSGGPLIDKDGHVIGVLFAESTTYDNVGYALTTPGAADAIHQADNHTQAVDTGSCTQ